MGRSQARVITSPHAGSIPAPATTHDHHASQHDNPGSQGHKDAEKHLEAALAGWTVLRLTERQLDLEFIERIVALLRQSSSSAETTSERIRRME